MNIILFKQHELKNRISIHDRRIWHVRKILDYGLNDRFDIGIINGPKGQAWIEKKEAGYVKLGFELDEESQENLYPVSLIIGHPRPQSLKKLFRETTAIGVSEIKITVTDTGEKSYYQSKIWKNEKYKKYLIEGAEQAHSTQLPVVQRYNSLKNCINSCNRYKPLMALDNIEPENSLSNYQISTDSHPVIAIGSERGWSNRERAILSEGGFDLLKLGDRILRTETASVVATALILEKLNIM